MRIAVGEPLLLQDILSRKFGAQDSAVRGVSIDSRQIKPGDLFIPLVGQQQDGHEFISDALKGGAALIFDSRKSTSPSKTVRVEDTKAALYQLVALYRNEFSVPLLGITGSNGKTTTKELLHHIISQNRSCFKTEGNFNSTVGMPLGLLQLKYGHQFGVVEMGVGEPGEMSTMCNLLKPDLGLITNIHPVHLEFFGSLDRIALEKGRLFTCLPTDGMAFVAVDDPMIVKLPSPARKISYSLKVEADLKGHYFEDVMDSYLALMDVEIKLPYGGKTMAQNALAAAVIALQLNIPLTDIKETIESFSAPSGRGNIRYFNDLTVIDDTYNANLQSVLQGVTAFQKINPQARHIVILGDMFELGSAAEDHHRLLGKYIQQSGIQAVFCLGALTRFTLAELNGANIHHRHFDDHSQLAGYLREYCQAGDMIYIKGSRGMAMEKIIKQGFTG